MNLLAFAFHTANECLEILRKQACQAKPSRSCLFQHIRTFYAYLAFPSGCSLMNALISCNPPHN